MAYNPYGDMNDYRNQNSWATGGAPTQQNGQQAGGGFLAQNGGNMANAYSIRPAAAQAGGNMTDRKSVV